MQIVYDPKLGTSEAVAHVLDSSTIVVPAGSFRVFHIAYGIAKRTGAET